MDNRPFQINLMSMYAKLERIDAKFDLLVTQSMDAKFERIDAKVDLLTQSLFEIVSQKNED